MDTETAAALEASIEKWKRNAGVKRRSQARVYGGSCPLCVLTISRGKLCGGCPVQLKTGQSGCAGSPWDEAEYQYRDGTLKQFRLAAQAEVEFLESLRETSADQKEIA